MKPQGRKVLQYDRSGFFIRRYDMIIDAQRTEGIPQSSIVFCCQGKLKTAGDYIWRYDEGQDVNTIIQPVLSRRNGKFKDGEVWKELERSKGLYKISDEGNIWRVGRIAPNPQSFEYGHCYTNITIYGKKFHLRVDKAVATHFIENPNKFPHIRHIDGNPKNCAASNLEWYNRNDAPKLGKGRSFFDKMKKENSKFYK